jgi:arylsulfatase A-like enzyme
LIKVPLVIKLPQQTAESEPRFSKLLVSNMDIFPTITGSLGINTRQNLQGTNIFSSQLEERTVFSEVNEEKYGQLKNKACIISGDWKLIKDFVTEKYSLYNITQDPGEKENRLKSEEKIATRLKLKLGKWIKINRSRKFRGKRTALTEEEMKKLKQLGYF